MMKVDEIRESFLSFFADKNHRIVSSDSLVPKNDPTLLFTSAGMNQFKEQFLGNITDFTRAASCQKCLRTADVEEVGKTTYHHTFFEMLGNFSFGDYFKEEAIVWAWEYLTQVLKIEKDLLWASVYLEDMESYKIWQSKIGLEEAKIIKMGAKDNFWPSNALEKGPDGPCGPCSEIYYDRGSKCGCNKPECTPACDCGRFVEVWNLVFTQFNRVGFNEIQPLPSKNIDTGMGLERLASVMQSKTSNFEIDTFSRLIKEIESKIPKKDIRSFNAIADHIRAIVFSISDGVYPSNEKRGYVVRRLIRRALWYGFSLNQKKPFLNKLVDVVSDIMYKPYPEIRENKENISKVILSEEERFLETIEKGKDILFDCIAKVKKENRNISSEEIFKLYDTYGFPLELTALVAEDQGVDLDASGFEDLMEKQRESSRKSSKFEESVFVSDEYPISFNVEFKGYEQNLLQAKVIGIVKDSSEVKQAAVGEKVEIVLDKTIFYPTSGGQLNDCGIITDKKDLDLAEVIFEVVDVKKRGSLITHIGSLKKGTLNKGDLVFTFPDDSRRKALQRSHTATHLLQAALRKILGSHVIQQGSLVDEDRFHFDFSHLKKISAEELKSIEEEVNNYILGDFKVNKYSLSFEEAKNNRDILAFFEEKYEDTVRVVEVEKVSKELCGGIHVDRTSEIGLLKIISESSVSSGIRRIDALVGKKAYQSFRESENVLDEACSIVKATKENITQTLKDLVASLKKQEKEGYLLKRSIFEGKVPNIIKTYTHKIADMKVIVYPGEGESQKFLGDTLDIVKKQTDDSALLMAVSITKDNKFSIVISRTKDFKKLSCNNVAKIISDKLSASGGGKDDFAFVGGNLANKKDEKSFITDILNMLKENSL